MWCWLSGLQLSKALASLSSAGATDGIDGRDKDEGPELNKINSPFPDLAQFHITQFYWIVMGRRDRAVKVID